MKRVIFIANTAWYLHNFRHGLMKAFRDAGCHVIACAPADGTEAKLTNAHDFIPLTLSRKGMNPLTEAAAVLRIANIYRRTGVDTALLFTIKPDIYGSYAARLARVRPYSTVTGLGYTFIKGGAAALLAKTLYRTALANNPAVFFQNETDRALFTGSRLVLSERTLLVPGSGVSLERFSPEACGGVDHGGEPRFLLVARVLKDKGVGEFIEAARMLKQAGVKAHFTLLGPIDQGNPAAFSEADVRAWEAEGLVTYAGTTDDVRPHLGRANCLVLPSYREGLPRSVIEAMACSLPVITTDAPGCRDTVTHEKSGLIVPVKDVQALFEAMRRFAEMPEEARRAMGTAARAEAEARFDERIVFNTYLSRILT